MDSEQETLDQLARSMAELEKLKAEALRTLMRLTGLNEQELLHLASMLWPGRKL
jgi:hypothetical protein